MATDPFIDLWTALGPDLILPHLDLVSFALLGSTSRLLLAHSQATWPDAWRIAVEVSPELRFAARSRARSMCASEPRSSVSVVDVKLPNRGLLRLLPKRISSEASRCGTVILDFWPIAIFRRQCSHTTELTADPWQPVVLRVSV